MVCNLAPKSVECFLIPLPESFAQQNILILKSNLSFFVLFVMFFVLSLRSFGLFLYPEDFLPLSSEIFMILYFTFRISDFYFIYVESVTLSSFPVHVELVHDHLLQ
jgi:hypothetical protein